MIYRALRDLDTGKRIIRGGSIFPSGWLQPGVVIILEEQGRIAEANLPPVVAIPRLKHSKLGLSKIGVLTASDYLEADDAALAKAQKLTEVEVRQYKAELYVQFDSPRPKN